MDKAILKSHVFISDRSNTRSALSIHFDKVTKFIELQELTDIKLSTHIEYSEDEKASINTTIIEPKKKK